MFATGRHGVVGLTIGCLLLLAAPASAVTLVEDGTPRATIVLPAEPAEHEELAAEELVEHLALMSGAELTVADDADLPGDMVPIYLGQAADEELDELSRAEKDNPSSFTLRVQAGRIDVRGLTDEGTLFGVYELLEQLGFRWYIPGELGRVVPEGETARIDEQATSQAPSMDWRMLQPWPIHDTPWISRMRLGGAERSTGAHFIPNVHARRNRGEVQPWKAKTEATNWERSGIQVCLSAPEALERAIEGYRERAQALVDEGQDIQYIPGASHDGGGYCECDGCKALDQDVYDPFGDRVSMTDRYIWFFNQVLDALEDEFPNLHIVHYTYGAHMMPPKVDHHERIVPVFAPITIDRIRGMDNPMSPDRHTLRWLIDEYADRGVNEMYYRGYYNNLADVQLPKTQIDRVRTEIPALHETGINVMRVEVIRQAWASDPITLYLAARLMWDVETDVDAVLAEFYEKFYGPAAEPMREYHERLEAAFRDTPYFTGSNYVYFPIFKDHPRRDALRSLLEDAKSLIEDDESIYAERLWAIRRGYERMDLFLDMIQARNRHDFETAFELMQTYQQLTDSLTEVLLEGPESDRPPQEAPQSVRRAHRLAPLTEHSQRSGNYLNRFFRQPIVAGYERAVENGEIVATLPDEWDFLLDPAEIGEIAGYHRPGELGGNWQPMRTSTRSWSDQGLHYYKGVAWYRTSVNLPADYEGRPLYLWFGGVDNIAHVWINGESVGTSTEPEEGLPGVPGSFRPFDMPATNAVNFGEENWIVVKIENRSLAELGTGGILAPVMFWTPDDPDWSPAE